MTVLYIASDRDGVGKTAVCAALARSLERRGKSVAVCKPLSTSEPGTDPDADIYRRLLDQSTEGWPLAIDGGPLTAGLLEEATGVVGRVGERSDVVIVEGSCALSADESERMAVALDASVLVVAGFRQDLEETPWLKGWQTRFGDRLLGLVVNGVTRYMGTDARGRLLPRIESEGLVSFGMIPEDRRLLGVTAKQVADHLGGRFIACEEDADAFVEHLMVGGMGMDPGHLYFGLADHKAVILRGDRPDIQMSALATPMSCLVLTKGLEPTQYVKYEAEQERVSVMIVETDTLGTMDALSTLIDTALFDHPLKLARFVELLERHVDLDALFDRLGLQG